MRDIYTKLLDLQASRIPFDVYTGKRFYKNMLIKSLRTTTDSKTEHSLLVTAHFKQLIIVSTSTTLVSVPTANQALPGTTAPTVNSGQKSLQQSPRFQPSAILGFPK